LSPVVLSGAKAALLEIGVVIRTGKDHCARASRSVLYFRPEPRGNPRLTFVSEGKPMAALAAGFVSKFFCDFLFHGHSPLLCFGARHITTRSCRPSKYTVTPIHFRLRSVLS
jgi:hypothetical protein